MAPLTGLSLFLVAVGAIASPLQKRAIDGLNTRAVAAGKAYFGSATDNGELTDTAYAAGLNNTADFGQITPGNSMKWDSIEPSRGVFSYAKGDVIANLAKANGQKLRCHTLVWHSQLPSWVSNGNFDNATLIEIMTNHITNEVSHFKGQCYHWDVVNEALNEDGTFRESVFYKTVGPAYIPLAFAAAAAADPAAKLYYNDYNIESAGLKSTGAQNIVKLVQQYGAHIDGVGMQAHFIVGSTPSQAAQEANMKAFVDLGMEVAITELDIRATTPISDADVAKQVVDYGNTVRACKAVERCVGVTIWDWTDKYSWIPSVFSGQGSALPWDGDLKKKDAVYSAILSAWDSGTAPTTTPTRTSTAIATPTTTTVTKSPGCTATAAPKGTAMLWGQCGGMGWAGPTVCVCGATCKKYNDWYSQCV
ncbi:putative endo-1,4-beta-xylanase [Delitschia confertaspora ATCC 74209]|uniref:Beta-xylanase n=1 Tax=Delitschia confertaspora ATCC 74209 TaxID=1513339 RepID=A0A9P4JEY6_9PLEO|nr:putative endo-1,4-beta-xylanase [Delitschia confertaspora ATCC 74209]